MNFPLGPQTVEGIDVIAVRIDNCRITRDLACAFIETPGNKPPCGPCMKADELVIFFSPTDYQRFLELRLMGEVE